ncbi:MAG: hypothetical protein CVV27_16125 [Candidatus Melainabacteria bacterium HGW-Melainabacteria-1]|nr:MAG: hypothetical protein CVV27_16125 [Candidatus Melainabacteria bacterium HGW-Melainabacteria-1]
MLLVAELRDAESLQQALHIALTGHLVLTTLHTSDAIGSLLRLVEVSANAYSVTESLNLILNQRLVRRLCKACRQPMQIGSEPAALTRLLAEQGLTASGHFWHAPGCSQCQTGYRGRIQLTEALTLSPALNAALIAQAPAAELRRIWLAEGGQSWLANGLARALTGDTSSEELLRAHGIQ